jgi:hypothetical protein
MSEVKATQVDDRRSDEEEAYDQHSSGESNEKQQVLGKGVVGVQEKAHGDDHGDLETLQGGAAKKPLETEEDIVTNVIDVDDDPSLSPWTFRMFFIGE